MIAQVDFFCSVPRRTKRWIPQPKKAHRIALSERSGTPLSPMYPEINIVHFLSADG